jgi:hypothetical protein
VQAEHYGKEKAIFLAIVEVQPIFPEESLHRKE